VGRSAAAWYEALLAGHEKANVALRVALLFRPLEVLAGGAALVLGGGLLAVALVHALSWSAEALRLRHIARRHLTLPAPSWTARALREAGAECLPLFAITVASTVLTQLPLILHRHADGAGLGVFALLTQLIVTLAVIPQSISQSLLPALTRASVRADGKDMVFLKYSQRIILLGGAVGALVLDVILPFIAPAFFGAGFVAVGTYAAPAVLLLSVLAVGLIQEQTLIARGHYRAGVALAALALGVLIACSWLMPSQRGVAEALVVMGSGIVIKWLLTAFYLRTGLEALGLAAVSTGIVWAVVGG
jgi:O-antigen/teichoic acid export membrane protein